MLNLVSTAVLPALVEEMVFRGYILGALRPQGDGLAIVFSAVFFGLLHGKDVYKRQIFHLSLPGLPVLLEPSRLQHTGRDAGCRPLLEGVR